MKRFIICFVACSQLSHGEDVTLVAGGPGDQAVNSQPITLNQGDSARLIYAGTATGGNFGGTLVCTIESKTFYFPTWKNSGGVEVLNPVAIAGPATVVLNYNSTSQAVLVTLSITRTGTASPPAEIPQEAGTTWDVILESSSDLINWTPANPGQYTGTEPKRFFRTRMVKKS
jgi:hypothetical protein